MSVFGEQTEEQARRKQLAAQVRQVVRRLAVEGFGTEAVEVAIPGFDRITRPGLADPLAGVQAGVLVRAVAGREIREAATDARAAGRSWDEIADALGLTDDEDGPPGTRAERAFEQVAGRSDAFRAADVRWTCAWCGQRVTDRGPFESHPHDREDGHAADCARQGAELAAWRVETGWEDE